MADTHLTIRRRDGDPYDELASELESSVAEAVRSAAFAVLRNPDLLEQIRAELATDAFIRRLQRRYGRLAALTISIPEQGGSDDFNFMIAQRGKRQTEPIDWRELDPRLAEADGGWTLDLVDPTTGYGLMGAWRWPKRDSASPHVLLSALHVPRPLTGPATVEVTLEDGRRAVESRDSDGCLHRYVLEDGNARHLPIGQHVARAYEVGK